MPARRQDPYDGFRFVVEIDQLVVAGFSEVSGLGQESQVECFREGGYNAGERELPGAAKAAARLVLKRGQDDSRELSDWFRAVVAGRVQRRDVSVLLVDAEQRELRRWKFLRACPVKWAGSDLRARDAEPAVESVEFVHEGLAP
ncbi:phage tail protein [Pseudorhodoferax sp.]|uniref:phage tail protein n=1 Tax=Pseudorhodoferax sp. TaxID=1993553 RepID=UPI0039E28CA3